MSPGLRRYLYVTAACTGAAIMIVEILGAKMLAPYLGTSHFVWTAQIAVTLMALAVGYYAGGVLVDRSSNLNSLYACILGAAVYLAVTILLAEPIAYACLSFKLAMGTLLASTLLFFVPLALMAMVGPFLIRVLTSSIQGVGGNVGRLTAISTLGSFVGTLLIGYVLIPFLPNSYTMYFTSALLTALSLAYMLVWNWNKRSAMPMAMAAGLGLALGYWGIHRDLNHPFHQMEELERKNSDFGMLQVLQERNGFRRIYMNDYLWQNTYDISQKKSQSMFTYMLHDLAVAYTPQIQSVLCIGMGVGIVPMDFARAGAKVDLVEINPAVVPIAQTHFNFEPDKFNLIIGDGRYFVNQCTNQYDAIILDAFLGDSSPSHLMTREAFQAMRRVLKPEGVLVINCFGDFEPGRDFLVASLDKTLGSVFASVRCHNDHNGGNVFFAASPKPSMKIVRQTGLDHVHPEVRGAVERAFLRIVPTNPARGLILTDNYNPVEFYDAANREEIRRYLAQAARSY